MKQFLDKDFLLKTEAAQKLFHEYASREPIFDFHNHLNPKDIYEDRQFKNLAQVWLSGDHYKWRAMRAAGVSEDLITGNCHDGQRRSISCPNGQTGADDFDYQQFLAYVRTLQYCMGNPLYHWTHLELQRYFGITEPLTVDNAREVWDKCNALLQKKEYSVRGLLRMQNVKVLCTTDDPIDDLCYHKKLAVEGAEKVGFEVRPSFRPDSVLAIEKPCYRDYIKKLGDASGVQIKDVVTLVEALEVRVKYFKENGALVSDHSLEGDFFESYTTEDVERVFDYRMDDRDLNDDEIRQYKAFVLVELGKLYKKYGLVMQIHIGAMRDNNTALLESAGLNCGVDSIADFNFAPQLSGVLNMINQFGGLPKTILYNLNPRDNEMLATLAGNFNESCHADMDANTNESCHAERSRSISSVDAAAGGNTNASCHADMDANTNESCHADMDANTNESCHAERSRSISSLGIARVQFGPAWWFNDHKDGIEEQLRVYARTGVLGGFVGMLTDSRSFLSFPRHEYFRRILCNFIGDLVENGEYPWDEKTLGEVVKNVCYGNAERYFSE